MTDPTPQQDSPSQQPPPQHINYHPYSPEQQARVAAMIYDATLHGGPAAAPFVAQLSVAYPDAAIVAHQCVYYHLNNLAATSVLPTATYPQSQVFSGAQFDQYPGSFVLRRINVSSIAWFCFFVGSFLASLRLSFIFGLAMAATLARIFDNEPMFDVINYVATQAFGDGPRNELYRWLFAVFTEQNPLHAFEDAGALSASQILPSHISAAILLTPVTAGMLCFAMGTVAAISVNFALRLSGGIRFESHND
eukprot:GFKZ01004055.1.p2 GENE.GFKZ01004055.1~~GFKZ01004055.1.p2  ORF type:complete len:250 (+),score=27.27 GFKZ01004055.1:289-1038(+)